MNEAADPPNGCFWCGAAQRDHVSRWAAGVGFHRYVPPTSGQRLARMLTRRLNKMGPSHGNDA